jgi:hypothetical protein
LNVPVPCASVVLVDVASEMIGIVVKLGGYVNGLGLAQLLRKFIVVHSSGQIASS